MPLSWHTERIPVITRSKDLSVLRNRRVSFPLLHTHTRTQCDTLSCSAAIKSRATCCWPIACNPACTRTWKNDVLKAEPREPLLLEILSPITDRSIDRSMIVFHDDARWIFWRWITDRNEKGSRVTFLSLADLSRPTKIFFWNTNFPFFEISFIFTFR